MKAALLLSGGFDSAIAGMLLRKRGVDLIAVHFSGEPFTDKKAEDKSRMLAEKIGCERFIVVPFGKMQEEIVKNSRHKYYYIITKRLMLKIAEEIAKKNDCNYLATGDNLAQVGSQTLRNISIIDKATEMEVLRPVLAYDKQEIIDLARMLGTFELSSGPEMCSLLGPNHPATRAKLEIIEHEEARIPENKIQELLAGLKP